MMLRTSELNLDVFGELKDDIRGTMLHHESIFKHQVRELHRLYWMQKTLMRELYQKQLDAKEGKLTMTASLKEDNVGSLEVAKGKSVDVNSTNDRGFNLELPASAYVEHSAKYFRNNGISRPVNYVRDINNDIVEGKGDHLLCHEVIDLGDTVEIMPHAEEADVPLHGFKIPAMKCQMTSCSISNVACDMPSSSKVEKIMPGFLLDLNQVYGECSESLQERKVNHAGWNDSNSLVGLVDASTTVSNNKQEEPVTDSSKPRLSIDLNMPQEDEFSYHTTNGHPINHTFSSQSSTSSVAQAEVLWKGQSNNNGNISNSNDSHSELSLKIAKKKELSSTQNEKSSFGEKQASTVTAENNNIEKDSVLNHARSEDTISTYAVKPLTREEKQQENLSKDPNDHAVSDAAKILADISLATRQTRDDSSTKEEKEDDNCRPEFSTDSFETMMLESAEVTSYDENLVMVQAMEIEKEEEVGSGRRVNRLRRSRGRVVKDFQKNILPGLVTLSRQEIYEDMHSIGYELRKNGGRRARGGGRGGSNWFEPVRSKRSKRSRSNLNNNNNNV